MPRDIPRIDFRNGNIFSSGCQALVNPVNCVGVMGAGLAFHFAQRYPMMLLEYQKACSSKQLVPGKLHYHKYSNSLTIINFPTKDHWKHPSRLEWVKQGLSEFTTTFRSQGIKSVAFPALGAGLGGLDWNQVRPLIIESVEQCSGIDLVEIWEPQS